MSIQLEKIYKHKEGYPVLDGLSLEIPDDAFLAIVAPTGTGKTTLMRVIAGLDRPDSGKIHVDGEDVTGVHVRDRNVAMVYQEFINYPSLNVFENIASPLRVSKKKYSKDEIRSRVEQIAEQLEIKPLLERLPQELSGGQQQRVALARALAKEARIVLLDEPLGNLDYKLRESLRVQIKELAEQRSGKTFIYATPEPIDALTMASHVAILHDGEIIQNGHTKQVYHHPNHVKSGEYFSSPPMNFIDCEIKGGRAHISEAVSIPMDLMDVDVREGQYKLGIRAHHLYFEPDEKPSLERDVAITTSLELAEIVGSDTTLHLSHDGMHIIALLQDMRTYELGEDITVYIDPAKVHLFDKESGELVSSAVGKKVNNGKD